MDLFAHESMDIDGAAPTPQFLAKRESSTWKAPPAAANGTGGKQLNGLLRSVAASSALHVARHRLQESLEADAGPSNRDNGGDGASDGQPGSEWLSRAPARDRDPFAGSALQFPADEPRPLYAICRQWVLGLGDAAAHDGGYDSLSDGSGTYAGVAVSRLLPSGAGPPLAHPIPAAELPAVPADDMASNAPVGALLQMHVARWRALRARALATRAGRLQAYNQVHKPRLQAQLNQSSLT